MIAVPESWVQGDSNPDDSNEGRSVNLKEFSSSNVFLLNAYVYYIDNHHHHHHSRF